ncbi:MAG: ATP-binding cassette domain-containing protein [Cytophagia bacterium]|nr:ATP-binding cassette domain-containing protein [Cytophagia bacterium]NBW35684.1 ATP-binding cassette domain-containing protein [Cytophagia bacterium]
MLNNDHLVRILRESALLMKHDFNPTDLRFAEVNKRTYSDEEFVEFKRDLVEAGSKVRLMLLEYSLPIEDFKQFIVKEEDSVIVFDDSGNNVVPRIIRKQKRKLTQIIIDNEASVQTEFNTEDASKFLLNNENEITFFVVVPYRGLVSEYGYDQDLSGEKMSPVRRFLRLLSTERKDIYYIFFYALVVGGLGLVLPLGIQTTIELVSGGVFFSSIYVLITLLILAVLLTGGLQLVQISLVEYLQRRLFAKASLEFAYRIPRIKTESIMGNYAPELVNRFFDIMTIQKGLPKLLIDLSSAAIQIFFGLLLLSLYHPFFVFFSMVLVTVLVMIFYFTGPRGLESSINESKYKYKVAQWLEELARALNSFKLAGNTDLPVKRTDINVNNYLKYRKTHFNVLISQLSFIIIFKAAVTGGLLIMGTILVVDRQITLGQFVASEVIIILILSSVEKIITYMDVVYDLLTAVDKVATVTDLPLEKVGGIDLPKKIVRGYSINLKDLSYKYPNGDHALNKLNLSIQAGERICISGPGGSGKTTLTNIIAGLQGGFTGIVTINNYSIRDLDLTHLRDKIAKNISLDDIFDGTLLENITVGKPSEGVEDAINAIEKVGLSDFVNNLPEGLNTHILSGGKGFSSSINQRLILARCIAKKPEMIILNDYFNFMKKSDKVHLIERLVSKDNKWTFIVVSNDPLVMASCDRVVVIREGSLLAEGKFDELMQQGLLGNYIE